MRSFVCGQCHVEYYCGSKETLFFPWANGLKIEQIEKTYSDHKFPDGTPFYDFEHGETVRARFKGSTSRIRTLESGCARAERRELRRLSYAVRAARRDEGQ